MRRRRDLLYIAQAALIAAMLLTVDFSLFEALYHMLR